MSTEEILDVYVAASPSTWKANGDGTGPNYPATRLSDAADALGYGVGWALWSSLEGPGARRLDPAPMRVYLHIYVEHAMAQVTIYLDDETATLMKKFAKTAGLSMSAWLAQLVREKTTTSWPDDVRALAGAWADDDFPTAEQLRGSIEADVPREAL